ncbi:CLUMA_CG001371, isoform A [Clunio marinus]|uniref:CLUMA_CG001371, isoform A n=1 Tax=Clunio marinus TaxID=568069 RepID=A0A1J1HM92_9DIPT|nr:CLUMA_CG001371, isoform A [Clunio marinus]
MKSVLILSLLVVAIIFDPVSGQIQCAPPNCDFVNRALLFPHNDPNLFYQCAPGPMGTWIPFELRCQCLTLFYTARQRCDFPEDWTPQCIGHDPGSIPTPCDPRP